ncbi:hypothetical protein POVWA1_018900 [Plasmodium ovale wallikeri]|uniref:Uncharacterized protein n=1 Tax=Plasmodium ovale wallikeri TaxID=864142 RepID=A0A1A8YQU8_PLAOA|nr:hypothetical protein POVWA1_018900 [Plasmodium ovale wallikeri]
MLSTLALLMPLNRYIAKSLYRQIAKSPNRQIAKLANREIAKLVSAHMHAIIAKGKAQYDDDKNEHQ